jgi:hypothetical protein
MAHTKKKGTVKLKRKLTIRNNIEKAKNKSEMKIVVQINEYINNLAQDLEKKILFFQKRIKILGVKIKKTQAQERKTAARLIEAEKKAVSQNVPAAKKRLKVLKHTVAAIIKESTQMQNELLSAKIALNNFKHELSHLKGIRKTVVNFSKDLEPNKTQQTARSPRSGSINLQDEANDDLPVFDKAFDISPEDVVDDMIHKNYSDDFNLKMDVLTEGGQIRKKRKKFDMYSDESRIVESRERGELSDDDSRMTSEALNDDLQPEVT